MSKQLLNTLSKEDYHYFDQIKDPSPYVLYKGKGALRILMKRGKLDIEGSSEKPWALTNKGCIFLNFANNVGTREYDWENKVTMALNEHEIGQLILCLTKGVPAEFYHDRNLGKPDQGKFIKKATFNPTSDKNAIMANCSVREEDKQTSMNPVPIYRNEAITLSKLLEAAIPQIMGW